MKKVILFLSTLLVIACSGEKSAESDLKVQTMKFEAPEIVADEGFGNGEPKPALSKSETPPPPPPPPSQNVEKKIIHTADIRFRVNDLKVASAGAKARVKAIGGYISNSSERREGGNLENTLTIRIPFQKFDTFLTDAEKESIYTDYKNVSAEDVTAEYVDNSLRIKSKQKVFDRYLELLKQAKNVQEIMAVEENIRVIREEIESKEGRQKFLDDQVTYSTITLTIYQVTESTSAPDEPFYTRIWHNFRDGWGSVFNNVIGIFYLIPYLLIMALIIYFIRRWWKKRNG
jgi:Domain of unknown function (DUF4349)